MLLICFEMLFIFGTVESDAAAKDNSWTVEEFTAPISRPTHDNRKYFYIRSAGSRSNPSGNGNGNNQDPTSGTNSASCSSNPTTKARPEMIGYGVRSQAKTKKQKALEKLKQEVKDSIQEEKKINAYRKKQGKGSVTLIIKDGTIYFIENDQLRKKYHHAPNLHLSVPGALGNGELARLSNNNLYQERLETFQNRKILPDAYIEEYGRKLRLHILDPSTEIIQGTLGHNSEAGSQKTEEYHFYNAKTGFNTFFEKNGKRYRTGFKANRNQKTDIETNNNIM